MRTETNWYTQEGNTFVGVGSNLHYEGRWYLNVSEQQLKELGFVKVWMSTEDEDGFGEIDGQRVWFRHEEYIEQEL